MFHSEFDNFDQLLNTVTGKDSVHTAHGIILQNIAGPSESHIGQCIEMPSIEKRKQRSLSMETPKLTDYYMTIRRRPKLTITHMKYPGGEEAFHETSLKQVLWMFASIQGQNNQKPVPGITGSL